MKAFSLIELAVVVLLLAICVAGVVASMLKGSMSSAAFYGVVALIAICGIRTIVKESKNEY